MIKIVTDSSAGLPEHLLRDMDIRTVPAHLDLDGTRIREQVDLTADQLYGYLAGSPDRLPQPVPPTVREFIGVYDQLIADAPQAAVVSIHVSERLSATLPAARQAAGEFLGSEFHLIDSRACLLGQGLIALAAARLARAGAPLDAVLDAVEAMSASLHLACLIDRERGRRLWADPSPGEDPHVLLALRDGLLLVEARFASRAAGLAALAEMAASAPRQPGLLAGVMHAACPEEGRALAGAFQNAGPGLLTSVISPAFGVVLGAGTLGLAWTVPPA